MHILLLELPQLLRGILRHAIAANGDFEVLMNEWTLEQPPTRPEVPPDVVILGLTDAGDITLLPGLFARWPQAQIMTLTSAGENAAVYQLRLGRLALEVVSPDEILRVLHDAVRRERTRVMQ